MTDLLVFQVRGMPVPQGSARARMAGKGDNARAYIYTGAKDPRSPLSAWRAAIRTAAESAMQRAGIERLFEGPLRVELAFGIPRPRAHYDTHGRLKASAPDWVAVQPDLDKLARAALDGMTGIAIVDDRFVAELVVRKVYAALPGLRVAVSVPGALALDAGTGNSTVHTQTPMLPLDATP